MKTEISTANYLRAKDESNDMSKLFISTKLATSLRVPPQSGLVPVDCATTLSSVSITIELHDQEEKTTGLAEWHNFWKSYDTEFLLWRDISDKRKFAKKKVPPLFAPLEQTVCLD